MNRKELAEGPAFTPSEQRDVVDFFSTNAGVKVLETLDFMAEEKNNLLKVINLSSGLWEQEKVGLRCTMMATEVRTLMQVAELFRDFEENANVS